MSCMYGFWVCLVEGVQVVEVFESKKWFFFFFVSWKFVRETSRNLLLYESEALHLCILL